MCFAKTFPAEFKKVGSFIPFMVGLMKLIAGMLTEIINILILIESNTIIDVVKDYVALVIIATIDDLMISTVAGINFGDEVDQLGLKFTYKR